MKKIKFLKRSNSWFSQADVEIAGKFLYKKFNGTKFSSKQVKELARPKSSPIHHLVFDKSIEEASEAYYSKNAYDLISSIEIIVEKGADPIRAFVGSVKVSDNDNNGFIFINEARSIPYIWDQVLDNALKELEHFEYKYKSLLELEPLFKTIQIIKEKVENGKKGSKKTKSTVRRKKAKHTKATNQTIQNNTRGRLTASGKQL